MSRTTRPEESSATVRSRRGRRTLTVILILLLLTLALAVNLLVRLITPAGLPGRDADLGGLEWVRSIYGMSDAPEDQLSRAQAAVPDSGGQLWVTDGEQGRIMRFTPDGQFQGSLSGPADAPLLAPSRMAFGPDGLLYVCDTTSDAIRVLDRGGNEAGSFNIPEPVSVAVSEDRIVVGAVAGFAILDKKGQPIKIVGSRGKGDGQFDYVHGVAIGEDGTIYIADSFNNRLSAWDGDGNRLWMVRTGKPANGAEMIDGKLTVTEAPDAEEGAEGSSLQLPLGITLDGAGRIVVADMFDCTLAVFNAKDGSFVGRYGAEGEDDGEFFYPVSVSYDSGRDWFAVADSINNRVQIVRIPGSSGGAEPVSAVRRALTGPLRACVPPLVLLIVVLAVTLVVRSRRARAAGQKSLNDSSGNSDFNHAVAYTDRESL